MVRISDIQDNSVLWETVPYCDIKENEISTYLLQPNDILFARTGGTVGKSYLVQEAQPNCNGKTLGKMLLPIPPLSEQYRIVERVNALFDYCNSI